MVTRPGRPFPLGAHWHGGGTRFAVWSGVATAVTLCLLDELGAERRLACHRTDGVWHVDVDGVGPGQRYGYRVDGPWDPAQGHLCDPAKLLVDPYARRIEGEVRWGPEVRSFAADGSRSGLDSAGAVPRSIVTSPLFDWGDDRRPLHRFEDSVIYEAHVKGATIRHPDVPPELRGTYRGLAHPAFVDHLRTLGVTAVELLPVHHFVQDERLLALGLRQYWGYNSLGWFAPHADYAVADPVTEFKAMVRDLHAAGIEVILDVVYNHTAESGLDGPVLAWRGLDHRAHYRLAADDPGRYADVTGTGNTVVAGHPNVIRTVLDSLRFWVEEMHVDGFRFDLAAALMRDPYDVDRGAAMLDAIGQDPTLAGTKLIAEPWDVGPGGYVLGGFPVGWSEWNGRFRDDVREFWRGERRLADLAARLTGSADLFRASGRSPRASVNFVTSHDGFTLADLVSFERKHNEANLEANRDGDDHSASWNHGVEGPTDDPDVLDARRRSRRALLATLFLSQGVPHLLGGDELGRSQGGNNNAYCQDNEISWFDWADRDDDLVDTVRRLVALRREHASLRRREFFDDVDPAITWLRHDGRRMRDGDWHDGRRSIVMRLEPADDDGVALLVVVNGDDHGHNVELPDGVGWWVPVVDTSHVGAAPRERRCASGTRIRVHHRSVVVLRSDGAVGTARG